MNEIFDHLWQSTVFTVLIGFAAVALRRNSPRLRYWLWLAASVKFLIPFSLISSIGTRIQLPPETLSPHTATVTQISTYFEPASALPAAAPGRAAFHWLLALSAIWLIGAFLLLFRWFRCWWTIHRAVRRAIPLPFLNSLPIFSSPAMMEPGVFGLFRPVLLLPEGITDNLTPKQFEAILAHELRHVRCFDNLTAAVHMSVEALFWFYPLVWWIGANLMDERERDCDEAVLRQGSQPGDYARGIVHVCETYIQSQLPCAPGISGSDLKERVRAIMTWRASLPVTLSGKAILASVAIAALLIPFVIGVMRAQSQTAPRLAGGERSLGPQTQLQGPPTAATKIPTAPQASIRTSKVIQEYRVGDIKVTGAKEFPNLLIRSTLGLVVGEAFDESRLRKGFDDLKKLYGSRGYINFTPVPVLDFDEQRKVVNLTINIDEDRQFIVNRIIFTGNTTTPDEVIRREILVKEGEVFNSSLWDLSLLRLNQLGFFEDIKNEDASIKPSPDEPKVDINLKLKEKGR